MLKNFLQNAKIVDNIIEVRMNKILISKDIEKIQTLDDFCNKKHCNCMIIFHKMLKL